jgi:hypothetical protein
VIVTPAKAGVQNVPREAGLKTREAWDWILASAGMTLAASCGTRDRAPAQRQAAYVNNIEANVCPSDKLIDLSLRSSGRRGLIRIWVRIGLLKSPRIFPRVQVLLTWLIQTAAGLLGVAH